MASRSRKRASDPADDFIVRDEPSRTKKSKTNATLNSRALGSSKSHGIATRKEDGNGDSFWEISKMRRVTISSFRGKVMVSLREYYEKDGEELPGKKGISLPIEQFSTLMTILPDIEGALKEKGVTVPRPDYTEAGPNSDGDDGVEDSTDELSGAPTSRKNIEATSDEDESEE
ncbi:transcriptional Coactivator p15-domain-containing protein [Aspergillus karnatakaensis]|uniref:transcriptional coactivator p15/PC4 family protein n=1 Tax=Aspergillus karnatakaensis TaxID=1810916 RepID=UPI003CCDFDC2